MKNFEKRIEDLDGNINDFENFTGFKFSEMLDVDVDELGEKYIKHLENIKSDNNK
jgi:hypothetical protein